MTDKSQEKFANPNTGDIVTPTRKLTTSRDGVILESSKQYLVLRAYEHKDTMDPSYSGRALWLTPFDVQKGRQFFAQAAFLDNANETCGIIYHTTSYLDEEHYPSFKIIGNTTITFSKNP